MATGILFLGPAPFFSIQPHTSLIQGMAGLMGLGYALVMISTFSRAQMAALENGFPDDISTYLMISGRSAQIKDIGIYLNATKLNIKYKGFSRILFFCFTNRNVAIIVCPGKLCWTHPRWCSCGCFWFCMDNSCIFLLLLCHHFT